MGPVRQDPERSTSYLGSRAREQEPKDIEVHWRARLEPVASSASGHERMVNSRAAASGEDGLICPQESSIR